MTSGAYHDDPRPATGNDAYALAAFDDEIAILARATSLRNDQLNTSAFKLGRFVTIGRLDRGEVERRLLEAAIENGYVDKHGSQGESKARRTIKSGLEAGLKKARYDGMPPGFVPAVAAPAKLEPPKAAPAGLPLRSIDPKTGESHPFWRTDAAGVPSVPRGIPDRFHMYPGKVRLKVKRGPQDYICLYRVRDPKDGAIGWQSHKPDGFVAVAYVGDGDPFNKAGPDDLIFWLEGEKDVDTAARMGLHAFTYGSSTEIPIEAEELVRGRRIVVLGDNDKSGRDRVEKICRRFVAIAADLRFVDLAEHYPDAPATPPTERNDFSDWVGEGGTASRILELVDAAPRIIEKPRAEAANASPGRELISVRASDIRAEPIEWVWPGRVARGKHTAIAGDPGTGKSQLLIAMEATITTGGPWPCFEGTAPRGSVIILSAEDGTADTLVPRLMAAGADLTRVHIVSAVRTGKGRENFNLQADLDLLEAKIREVGDCAMVGIDPISSYLGRKTDSHKNSEVRQVLEPVGLLAERLRVAVVSVTHFSKGGSSASTKAVHRFIGSIAFIGAPRAAFVAI